MIDSNRIAREAYTRTIADARAFGIDRVEYLVMDDACAPCRALVGRTFELATAPPLPLADCRSKACRCDIAAAF